MKEINPNLRRYVHEVQSWGTICFALCYNVLDMFQKAAETSAKDTANAEEQKIRRKHEQKLISSQGSNQVRSGLCSMSILS